MNALNRNRWIIAVVVMLAAGTIACSSTQTTGEQMSDAWITSKVTARMTADPEVNPFEIDVDTTDGAVRLSGMVETDRQRQEAEEIARNTEGVKRVDNDIRIGDPSFRENIDDSWISTKIKSKLAADPDINKFNIDVDVLQGVVTLSGTVKTSYARANAEEIASRTKGVVDVKNLIEVEE
ncbi:MAG TPA: BON domain-containing protein [Candidatus Sulfomarinibacteraceae bacterium]|nr:BON domain-containing protein [Candidatus Sulfomarinibacteraceae bacterium]